MLPSWHARGCVRASSLLLVPAGILALVAAPAPAPAKPKPRPEFKVRSVGIDNPDGSEPLHMFWHSPDLLQAHVKVKNTGHAAGKGHGVLKVQGSGQLSPTKIEFPIPRLKPGKSRVIDVDIIATSLAGTGVYTSAACVGNKCQTGPGFAVIPEKWEGTTHSVVDDNGIVSTCDGRPTFSYNHPASGADRFVYRAGGFVSCIASGTQGGCTYSGGGEDIAIEQFLTILQINASLDSYNAVGASSETYEALKECQPDPPVVVNLDVAAWLTTGNYGMDSADTTLSGSLPIHGDTWSWNLTGD